MKILKVLFVALFLFLISCNSSQKTSTEKSKKNTLPKDTTLVSKIKKDTLIKKEIVKKTEKRWDTITRKNAGDFLIAYGKKNPETKVLIKTKFGNIKLRLFKNTPLHRASFIFLTKTGYFNGTVFYRVVKNFVVQGGDSDSREKSKMRNRFNNYLLSPEYRKNRKHNYGALAAAREYDYNPYELSTPFEFYIVQAKHGAHHLDNKHTVFGQVISGFSTINKIALVKTGPGDWPEDDIHMKVEVLD